MEDHLQNQYNRSFPGCMKGLAHFLSLQHHHHIRKMKMLTYRKHGEGKQVASNKESRTYPEALSTSKEILSNADVVEDKVHDTRKQRTKSSIRISFPKWRYREHNNKKIKGGPPSSMLLRTSSIHRMSENHAEMLNLDVETSTFVQEAEENQAFSFTEQAHNSHSTNDELNLEEHCDENTTCSKTDDGELESLLHTVASFAQKDANDKGIPGDVMLSPSKEFLDMMNLFNGNIELIRKILEDPSFIFAHYLQSQRHANAQLVRHYSFPALGKLERSNGYLFRGKHRNIEGVSLFKQSGNVPLEDSFPHTDTVRDNTLNSEIKVDSFIAPSNILQKRKENPIMSSHFRTIKRRIKDIITDSKKEHQNHISMDGFLHKIPYGKYVLKDMKKGKPGQCDVASVPKLARESSSNKSGELINKNIQRSQSLNESSHKYSHLYETITRGEVKSLPQRAKLVKATAGVLGRTFSLSDVKYCSPRKDARIEDHFRPTSVMNSVTLSIKKNLEREKSKEFITEESSNWTSIDYERTLLSNKQERYEFSENLTSISLISEGRDANILQEQKLTEEEHLYEPTKSDPISKTWSFALEDVSTDLLGIEASKDARIEDHFRPTSVMNSVTLSIEKNLEREESKEFITEESSNWTSIDYERTLLSNKQEQYEFSENLTSISLISEGSDANILQEQKLTEEEHLYEPTKSDPISKTWSFALEDVSADLLGIEASKGSEHKNGTELGFECIETLLQTQRSSPETECYDFLLQFDPKHEAEFNYVKEILKSSEFIGNDFLGSWHNPYQPIDPLIFLKAEGLDYEIDIEKDEHDLLKRQLLFDMINEALVELYEDSFGQYFPWLSHFSTSIRPVPMGHHILEGVWAIIYWHLKGQFGLDDDVVARDFMKNDGWMSIQYDIEDVEIDVECLIMDDLLDEVVLELSGFNWFPVHPH